MGIQEHQSTVAGTWAPFLRKNKGNHPRLVRVVQKKSMI